jgi:signal transduction histidine kinase
VRPPAGYALRDLLRAVWEEPRAPNAPRRVWRDWALLGVLVAVALVEGVLRPDLPWRPVSVAVTVGLLSTVLWRRTRPLLTVAIAIGGCGVLQAVTGGTVPRDYVLASVVILVYSLFRWGSGREAVSGSVIVLATLAVSVSVAGDGLAQVAPGAAAIVAVAALGVAFRYRAMARARELDRVKLLERERLARDLHDTVAHHVSAIAIRAQAGLAASPSQPDAAADALRLIEAEASRALGEMRAMVRVLRRSQPADPAQSPSIADLGQLAGRSRGGPAVDVEVAGDVDDLSSAVVSAIYRLAQESVTNARRHARHATRIEVRVAADERSVRLRVSDDGEAGHPRSNGSPGYGLTGMTERAGLLGGICEAGPNPDRGWTVTAVLPRTPSPA